MSLPPWVSLLPRGVLPQPCRLAAPTVSRLPSPGIPDKMDRILVRQCAPACRVHACCFPSLVDGRRASGPTPGAGIARPTPSLVVRAKNVACNHPESHPALSDREFRERILQ